MVGLPPPSALVQASIRAKLTHGRSPTPTLCQRCPPWGQSGTDSVFPKFMSTRTSEDDLI